MNAATDLSSVVYLAMEGVAVSGTFHMSAPQLARIVWRVRPDVCRKGKPPPRTTIYRIWTRFEERGLIKLRGYTAGGVKKWEMLEDAALDTYAKFRDAIREERGVTRTGQGGAELVTLYPRN